MAGWAGRVVVALLLMVATTTNSSTVPRASVESSARAAGWQTHGPDGGAVRALAPHPRDPEVVLAGTPGGLFRSDDGGATWTRSSTGLGHNTGVRDIAYAPSSPNVVYAATGQGVFRSADGGATWSEPGGFRDLTHVTVAVHPQQPDVVFAGTLSQLFRSTDGGATATEGLLAGSSIAANDIVIAPSDPDVVYASGNEWVRSTDGGVTWGSWTNTPTHQWAALVRPTEPSTVFVGTMEGIHRSEDGGATWSLVHDLPILMRVTGFASALHDPDVLYAATDVGVVRSRNGGSSWAALNEGLPRARPRTWSVAATADGGRLLAGTHAWGVFARASGERRWHASYDGLVASSIEALAVPPSGGPLVFAAGFEQGVARSLDHGETWEWMGLRRQHVQTLAVHPRDRSTVLAAGSRGLFRSRDRGGTWERILDAETVLAVAYALSDPSIIYAGTLENGNFRSVDGGETWEPLGLDEDDYVNSFAVHPRRPFTVYAGGNHGIIRSTDGLRTWRVGGLPEYAAPPEIAIDPTQPSRLYAAIDASSGAGIFISTDAARTWRRSTGGTPPESSMAVAIDQRRPWVVYASGDGPIPGVFRSTDRGITWAKMNRGLTTESVGELELHPSGSVLHAGSHGGGVFSRGTP